MNRVLIADDNPAVRADLRALLDLLPEVDVVGEVAAAEDILQVTRSADPDVVVVDLVMGGPGAVEMDGLEAIRDLKRELPQTTVYVLTVHGYPAARQAALRAGADAFFVKGADTGSPLSVLKTGRACESHTPPQHTQCDSN